MNSPTPTSIPIEQHGLSDVGKEVMAAYDASHITEANRQYPSHLERLCSVVSGLLFHQQDPIRDILEGKVSKPFTTGKVLFASKSGNDIIRTQTGTVYDLFDNKSLRCCTFLPDGKQKEEGALYVVDPDIALLHLIRFNGGVEQPPSGVAICVYAVDKSGKNYLMVDGVEGHRLPKRWKAYYGKAIRAFAEENGFDYIFYNTKETRYDTPRAFINSFYDKRKDDYWLRKRNLRAYTEMYGRPYGRRSEITLYSFPGQVTKNGGSYLFPRIIHNGVEGFVTGFIEPIQKVL